MKCLYRRRDFDFTITSLTCGNTSLPSDAKCRCRMGERGVVLARPLVFHCSILASRYPDEGEAFVVALGSETGIINLLSLKYENRKGDSMILEVSFLHSFLPGAAFATLRMPTQHNTHFSRLENELPGHHVSEPSHRLDSIPRLQIPTWYELAARVSGNQCNISPGTCLCVISGSAVWRRLWGHHYLLQQSRLGASKCVCPLTRSQLC